MADTKAARMAGYYAELNKFIENSNNQKIIKTANKILAEEPEELKAWQCKIVAQIHQNQFQEALSTIKKSKFIS
ncbi:hypothetical protein SK128_027646 [Halocaridina rubra]|uniref:Uncharacterized protein n=1 Tax=Halocaridina rubra TaxID=373956 RepID=A0AAN8XSL5_HALRR